ncbi:WD40 repeat domain-containing protein [Streptomyces sp. NP-1717]|uniref:WD40 repeat domain-containing protein n=1 Tax=Streptomyces sp. NP-1717 TaxID=2704470 RepID=UPI001F5C0F36|nr:WD40 repeat domain-containing protein [Streptomyces sp. NP-1717]MCI3221164.1 PQQ-binding-like beta-propeller repeat protein [Streptomyces sp. NP-1717]
MARESVYSTTTLAAAASGERLPSLAVALAYATACGANPAEWEERWQHAAALERAQPSADQDAVPPYTGLRRFQPEDHERYFGRDELVGTLTTLVAGHRITAVVGASGSGKSSLLRAGLIPALRTGPLSDQRPAAIRVFTPGRRPATAHGRLLEPGRTDGEGDTVVLVDQFEEIFTLCHDTAERERFISLMLTARDPRHRLRVVIAVRADFFGHCADNRELAETLRESTLLVGPTDSGELREAIVKPAAAAGLIVERGLTKRLIEEISGEPGGLPLLSHVLLETWRRRRGRSLTMDAYEATGGIHGAVAQTAEDIYSQLPPGQAEAARRILLRLISPGDGVQDTRRPAGRDELRADEPGDAAAVLEQLARARLITLDDCTVNLTHEALISGWPRLRRWIDNDRERLRLQRRLTDDACLWEELGYDTGALYRGTRLADASEAFASTGEETGLTPLEQSFLDASTAARRAERRADARSARRLRASAAALSVLLVLAVIAAGLAFGQRRTALTAQDTALSRQLAAQSLRLAETNPDLASLLAVQAYRTSPTAEARASLYSAGASPLRRRLTENAAQVLSVAFSPDGRTVAIGRHDGTVRLRDAATGRTRSVLKGDFGPVYSVVFSPDGRTMATLSEGSVRLRDTRTGRPRTPLASLPDWAAAVTFTPEGRVLAVGSDGSVWDVTTGRTKVVRANTSTEPASSAVAVSLDSRTLAISDRDRTVRIRDLATGRTRHTLTHASGDSVRRMAFSPDGKTLATGTSGGNIRLWDMSTGRVREDAPRGPITGHSSDVTSLAFSPDGKHLSTAAADSAVHLWDLTDSSNDTALTGHTGSVGSLAFSPNSRTLATSSRMVNDAVRLWNVAPDARKTLTRSETSQIRALAFRPDGQTLIASSEDREMSRHTNTARLWHLPTGRTWAFPTSHTGMLESLAVSPDGRAIAAVRADEFSDDSVHLWDVEATRIKAAPLPSDELGSGSVVFSPDGNTVAFAMTQGAVGLWNVTTGRLKRIITGHTMLTRFVGSLAFSPDGRTLAVGKYPSTIQLWNTRTGRLATTLNTGPRISERPVRWEQTLAFSPDGETLASADFSEGDGATRLWDVTTGRSTVTFASTLVTSLAFSPDGRTLATASDNSSAVRLWDAATGFPQARFSGYAGGVASLAFSPNGRTLATGGNDGKIRLWDSGQDRPAETIKKVCRSVGRELTPQERKAHLPDQPSHPVCPT